MRVLINALQAGNRSGTGRYTEALVEWLPKACTDLEFVFLWPSHVPHPPVEKGGQSAFLPCNTSSAWRRFYLDQAGMSALCRRTGVNVVHYPASIGCLFPLRNMVLTVHDLAYLHHPEWFTRSRALYYRMAIRASAWRAARIIADSEATARDIVEHFGIGEDRIDVVYLGVDDTLGPATPEQVSLAKERYHLPAQYVLYVGTLEPRKNIPRIIEAWSRVADVIPHDLVLAGREGWRVEPIRAAIAASPHAARIHRPGFLRAEDAPAVMTGAAAFIWPSLWEGFGLPPLEAMACGTPVVTSNVSSLPEVAGDAALTVDPYDVEALATAIRRVAASDALRTSLRAKGIAQAQHFTWKRTAAAAAKVYRRVLGIA